MKKKSKKVNVKKLIKHIKNYKKTCLNNNQQIIIFNGKVVSLILEFGIEIERLKNKKEF